MTNEEQGERYELIVSGAGLVEIFDNEQDKSIAGFAGPNRLLAATAELNRLNAAEETARTGMTWQAWTPAEFLTKTLPAVARRQRIEGHLAEVKEIEESLARVLAEDAANLQRATALREKLEKELSGPPSSTETTQNALGVGQDLPTRFQAAEARRKPGSY